MNPWVTIWTNTTETIDKFKDSDWVNRAGFLPYFVFGINAASEAEIPRLLGYGAKSEGLVLVVSIMLIVGILAGIILKVLWVNVIFFFGKIWKGQASRRNIDTVVSLCLFQVDKFDFEHSDPRQHGRGENQQCSIDYLLHNRISNFNYWFSEGPTF